MTDESGPQTENGYTRIANEVLEDILAGGFNKRELLVLFSIIRKTYGFNKTQDEISASQIAIMTGLAREHVARTINSLVNRGVVLKQSQRRCNVLSYQKKANLWASAKTAHVPKQHTSSAKTVTSASAKTAHTKDNLKDTLKDKAQAPTVWDSAKAILGGGLLGKLLKQHPDENIKQATLATLGKQPADPKTFLLGVLKNGTNGSGNSSRHLSASERVGVATRERARQDGRIVVDPHKGPH